MSAILDADPKHWPTLNTVIMVEQTINKLDDSIVTVPQIKRALPRKVNHNTLKLILKYLEESNKIAVSIDGITWIHNQNQKLQRAIQSGLEL